MPPHADAATFPIDRRPTLLVLVPGMGMRAADFRANRMIAEVERRGWPVTVTAIDPGPDAYLGGSVEHRLLDGIEQARAVAGASRIWLAGVSLGCQGLLRCVRRRPELVEGGLVEGLLLLTPYLASTGLIADVVRRGGLRPWARSQPTIAKPEHALLAWLATTPALPRMLVGQAEHDRFATTATLLAALIPDDRMISVPGQHNTASWAALWRLMLDRNPFSQPMTVAD